MRSTAIRFLVAIALLHLLSGCAVFYTYEDISEKPVHDGADAPLQARTSTLQPALSVPLVMLQDAANNAASSVLPFTQRDRAEVGRIEIEVWPFGCVFCHSLHAQWEYTVDRPSPIRLTGANDELAIVVPASLSGRAGFNGFLAELFDLDWKDFGAAAEIDFKGGLKADIRYCPAVRNPWLDVRWTTDPFIELVGKNCIMDACIGPWELNVKGPVESQLGPQVSSVMAQLESGLPCEPVRQALGKVWRSYSLPVKLPYNDLFLNITPEAMYFPGLGVDSTNITVAGRLDAKVALDIAPISAGPLPLPQNDPLPITPGRFSIAVPVSTKYYTFEALAKQALMGQRFHSPEPLGGVIVTPQSLEVFPTDNGESLAIGVAVAVEFKYLFFLNTSGTVWLKASPAAVDGGRRVRISDVAVTRKFSNPIWNFASALLDDRITAAVKDGFELDLNPPLQQAEQQLGSILAQAGQTADIELQATDVKVQVGRMLANDEAFQLEAILDAVVKANLGQLAAP